MQLHLAAAPCFVGRDGAHTALAARDAALLAWLALEGPTPRLRLAALLWPDSEPETARNSLRQRLFKLRKQLGVTLISGSTDAGPGRWRDPRPRRFGQRARRCAA